MWQKKGPKNARRISQSGIKLSYKLQYYRMQSERVKTAHYFSLRSVIISLLVVYVLTGQWISPLSPVNVASVFLDNAARLAQAHRASSARTTRCSYIRATPDVSNLSFCGQKWASTCRPPPPSQRPAPHLPACPDPFTATGSTLASIQSLRRSGGSGAPEAAITSVSCFCNLPASYL